MILGEININRESEHLEGLGSSISERVQANLKAGKPAFAPAITLFPPITAIPAATAVGIARFAPKAYAMSDTDLIIAVYEIGSIRNYARSTKDVSGPSISEKILAINAVNAHRARYAGVGGEDYYQAIMNELNSPRRAGVKAWIAQKDDEARSRARLGNRQMFATWVTAVAGAALAGGFSGGGAAAGGGGAGVGAGAGAGAEAGTAAATTEAAAGAGTAIPAVETVTTGLTVEGALEAAGLAYQIAQQEKQKKEQEAAAKQAEEEAAKAAIAAEILSRPDPEPANKKMILGTLAALGMAAMYLF